MRLASLTGGAVVGAFGVILLIGWYVGLDAIPGAVVGLWAVKPMTAVGFVLLSAAVTMLEPYDRVTVLVPDELIGPVMSDLSSRRGRLLGTDKVGNDRTQVLAEVPQTELVRYAVDLRSATHGAGVFTRSFAHYEPMPEDVARTVAARG